MRQIKILLLLAAQAIFCSSLAIAAYPDKPIKFVVPWPPGGATDQVARALAQPLSQALGVSVFIENKGGAGGNIGTAAFVKDKADGYSIIMATSSTNAAGVHLYANQGFDPIKDFTPVILICNIPNIMVVPTNSKWNNLRDLLSDINKNPGKHTYGSAGIGSSQHLAGAQFKVATGANINHVPYKGSGPAAIDLMAGHIDMMIDTGSMANIKGGKLKALAVASKKRLTGLPDVPTMEELKVPMLASAWYGIMLPANAPADVVARLNTEFTKILNTPEMRTRLQAIGAEVGGGSSQEFKTFVASEINRYESLIKLSGAPKE